MSQFYDPKNEYTVPYGAGIPLIVYDPGLTDVKITGYEDLWNPALENNVALTANYRVIDGITLKTMGESFNTEDLDVIRAAGEKLLSLAPNIRVINDNNTQDYLISGEVAAAFLLLPRYLRHCRRDRIWKWYIPRRDWASASWPDLYLPRHPMQMRLMHFWTISTS